MTQPTPVRRKAAPSLFHDLFRPDELKLLRRLNRQSASLADEIDLLRIGLRRMAQAFGRQEEHTLKEHHLYLNALGQACARLERLVETETQLHALDDDLKAMLNHSLRLLIEEWNQAARPAEE